MLLRSKRSPTWAKNIIAVGGIRHQNTGPKNDDSWSGGASIGPAADGRIKPDLASFYDNILCTDQLGAAGYSGGSYYSNFGGTSGATPIVAGNLALFYEMWHAGVFGNPNPGATPFENAPKNTTAKAVLINTAQQWAFNGTNHDLTRVHQGWGHPFIRRTMEFANRTLVIDETDVLTNLQSTVYSVTNVTSSSKLRVTLVYRDPPGTTSSSLHRINDLDLKVTSPSGDVYYGNAGLRANMFSPIGGSPNTVDTVEVIIVDTPELGTWLVEVTASEVNEDNHPETPGVDVDYALVVTGIEIVAVPASPINLTGSGARASALLRWQDVADEDGYSVERSLDGTTFVEVGTVGPNVTSFRDTGLTPRTTYTYRVRAFNFGGYSAYSSEITVTTHNLSFDGTSLPRPRHGVATKPNK